MAGITDYKIRLIEELEHIISKNFHNKYTSNYDGTEGRTYRYPAHMDNPNDHYAEYVYRGTIFGADERSIGTLRYECGANSLYIGDALVEVLDYLEDRYDLDFDELETNCPKYWDGTPILFEDEEDEEDDDDDDDE